jgi:hypothetical protein
VRLVVCLTVALAGLACRPRATTTIHFPHSTEAIPNPERGFVVDVDLVEGTDFAWVRAQGLTLGYAGVRLDPYRYDDLPPELLEALDRGLARVRDAGIKVIVRFLYNHALDGADAPKERVLGHIAQLQPVLVRNADVIAVLDAGFIGAWGEWHGSTHGLDNQRDRGDVLWALLTALPASRSTMVRSPLYKAAAYGAPLAEAQAFDGSHPSRVGHLNSCFLASDNDFGTYGEPIDEWKAYVAAEGRFTPVGGETCAPNPPRTDCATAREELARLHWSFLNSLYHEEVLATWRAQGCYDEIARDLGYRFELRSATFDERVAPGGLLHLTIRLENTGYAAMFNARPVYVTFDDLRVETDLDPRRWEPGSPVTLRVTLRIPASTEPGMHRLGLWLPDADPRLREPARVDAYSVRIGNARWDAPVNVLTDELVVDADAPGPVDPRATALELVR